MSQDQSDELSAAQLKAIEKLVDELGELEAAAELGVHMNTMLRVLARRPNVRRGSVALLRQSLERLAKEKA